MKRRMKRHAVTQPLGTSYRLIALTQNQNAIVDVTDFEWLDQWNWFAALTRWGFYAQRRNCTGEIVHMHREIIHCLRNREVDHRNGDGLDNRKENLRPCTHLQNVKNLKISRKNNRSGFKGVSFDSENQKWQAHIQSDNKNMRLGRFSTKEEAAGAYNEAAKKYHREFASLNIIPLI